MSKILLFGKAVLKSWWRSMSCALFTLLSFWAALTNQPNSWIVRSTGVFAVLLLFYSVFRAWVDENDKVQVLNANVTKLQTDIVRMSDESTRQQKEINHKDWEDLANNFRELSSCQRADFQSRGGRTEWHLAGASGLSCRSWICKAGALLLSSPQLLKELPPEILSCKDTFTRWLDLAKLRGHATYRDFYSSEDLPDGTKRITMYGSINNLAEASSEVCIWLSALEVENLHQSK